MTHSMKRIFPIFILTFSFSTVCLASPFTVTNVLVTSDGVCNADCSFREAIHAANAASSDDSIEFDPVVFSSQQTVNVSGHVYVEGNGTLTINGTGAGLLTLDGLTIERILTIRSNANVTIN